MFPWICLYLRCFFFCFFLLFLFFSSFGSNVTCIMPLIRLHQSQTVLQYVRAVTQLGLCLITLNCTNSVRYVVYFMLLSANLEINILT